MCGGKVEMKRDFAEYLTVRPDGTVWWRLIDATKLGAGFVPDKDGCSLVATKPEQIVRQRNLFAKFVPGRASPRLPKTAAHEGHRYVEAQEFLVWLRRVLEEEEPGGMAFPGELAAAVQSAIERRKPNANSDADYVSLGATLEPWFGAVQADLPDPVWRAIEHEVFLSDWDALAPDQRRSVAQQLDNQRDPAKAGERKYWWDYGVRRYELEARIAKWETASGDSVTDMVARESALTDLRKQLAALDLVADQYEKATQRAAQEQSANLTRPKGKHKYIPYVRAVARWAERFDATPEEVAAWVYFGPDAGGLSAYLNANELDPPPRFFYGTALLPQEKDWDYVEPLMSCWFRETDVESFEPLSRFITGDQLVKRWAHVPAIRVEAFIAAKVRQGALSDIHPITHSTRASKAGNDVFPPLMTALFDVTAVAQVEVEEFGWVKSAMTAYDGRIGGVTIDRIASAFRVRPNADENLAWWIARQANCKGKALERCRVGPVKVGRGSKTLWRPDLVAAWLLGRIPKDRGGMPIAAMRRGLLQFPDCGEAAQLLFPADD